MAIKNKKKTLINLFPRQWQRRARNAADQPFRKLRRCLTRVGKRVTFARPPADYGHPIIQPRTIIYNFYDDLGRLCTMHALVGPDIPREAGFLVAVPVEYCSHNKSAEWHHGNIDYCSQGGAAVLQQQNVVDNCSPIVSVERHLQIVDCCCQGEPAMLLQQYVVDDCSPSDYVEWQQQQNVPNYGGQSESAVCQQENVVDCCCRGKYVEWQQQNEWLQQGVVNYNSQKKSVVSQQPNVTQLNEDMNKLRLFPHEDKPPTIGDASVDEVIEVQQNVASASVSESDDLPKGVVFQDIAIDAGWLAKNAFPAYYATPAARSDTLI